MRRALAHVRLGLREARRRPGFWAVVLVAVLAAATIASASLGAVTVPRRELLAALADPEHPAHVVLWQVRFPRIAAALAVGSSLGLSGALLQTALRNPLADPGLVGVNAGAGLAGILAIVFAPGLALALPALSFVGGLAAVLVILLAAWGPGRRPAPLKIILSGVAVQAVLFSMIALVTFFFAERAPAFVSFTVGSLNGTGWSEAALAAPGALVGLGLALAARRSLDLLLLDDTTAAGVGLRVEAARLGACCLSALLAASAVSVAGLVGFVGLVVPNWVRLVSGPHHGTLLPLTALGGATLVVVADLVARTVAAPLELPVGALLALVGGPYFLFVLWRELP